MLLSHFLKRRITVGTLRIIDAAGRPHECSGEPGPVVTVRLRDPALHHRLALNPHLRLGEAYMDGTLTVEDGTIYDFLALLGRNLGAAASDFPTGLLAGGSRLVRRLQQYNPVRRARANAAHHYDLCDRLYEVFLDSERQYSSAYFLSPNESLEAAQRDKMRHIAAKLLLRPGLRILDIGSGWGGLALFLARISDAQVTGITLSEEQRKYAERRAAEAGLEDRVRFRLRDYREVDGRYDRIVSVGMFEHVGSPHYRAFFTKVRELLAPDGVALLHSIGRGSGPSVTNPWIRKYIFPGGYIPALSEVVPAVEKSGLLATDIEILRLHYAETLREWRRRFLAHAEEMARLYDERFVRMWEFYLAGSEVGFRYWNMMVFQMQLARAQDAVPVTRDYVTDFERAWREEATAAE